MNFLLDIPSDISHIIDTYLDARDVSLVRCTCSDLKNSFPESGSFIWRTSVILNGRFAAEHGYLSILKWMKKINPPGARLWDEYTCYYAARKGQDKVLEWLKKNGVSARGVYGYEDMRCGVVVGRY